LSGIAGVASVAQELRPPDQIRAGDGARPLLGLAGVAKAWGSRRVLDGVELRIEPGTVTWVGGHNGSGKTTLLRIAAGLIAPDAGNIDLRGLHPRRDRREYHRRLGFLSAGDRGIYGRLTAREHLELWARLALVPGRETGHAIAETVERLALAELLPHRADRLSMGQRQRLRLAMAFLHAPEVVLLDEPLTSLDEAGIDALNSCLARLVARGGAAVWCSPGAERGQPAFDARHRLEYGRLVEAAA
jgi:ABC-2 type transport system ATP-binding protein